MKLYIVRHGETDWNKEKRPQGQSDTTLNDYGRELARITADAMKDLNFDYAFSSPLKRAHETAEIIMGDRKTPIVTDDRLKEISFGIYEGTPSSQLPASFQNFFENPGKYAPPEGGESYQELKARTKDFIDKVLRPLSLKEPDAKVIVFGHGAMNKSMIINLKGLGIEDIWGGTFQRNCCVNIFELNGDTATVIEEAKIYY